MSLCASVFGCFGLKLNIIFPDEAVAGLQNNTQIYKYLVHKTRGTSLFIIDELRPLKWGYCYSEHNKCKAQRPSDVSNKSYFCRPLNNSTTLAIFIEPQNFRRKLRYH